jgi:hypothetical protein
VGNESHCAAVPSDRDPNLVQEFGCWTADLVRIASGSSPAKSTRWPCRRPESTGLRWKKILTKRPGNSPRGREPAVGPGKQEEDEDEKSSKARDNQTRIPNLEEELTQTCG